MTYTRRQPKMMIKVLLFLLAIETTMGYLHEVSIGVFMEASDRALFSAINQTMDKVSHMVDNAPQDANVSTPVVNISLRAVPIELDNVNPFHLRVQAQNVNLDEMPALISLVSCRTTHMLQELTSSYQIPIIYLETCASCQTSITNPMVLPMDYGYKDILYVLVEVIKFEDWREVVVYHDATFANRELATLNDRLSAELISVMFIDITQITDDYIAKYRYELLHSPHFVALCSETNVTGLLEKVRLSPLELIGPNYLWLVVLETGVYDIQALERSFVEGDNTALLLRPQFTENDPRSSQILSGIVHLKHALELFASSHPYSSPTAQWNSTQNRSDGNSFTNLLQNEFSKTCEGCTDYDILSLTQGQTSGQPHFVHTGQWDRQEGLQLSYHLYPFTHQGYNNRKFIMATLEDPPLSIKHVNGTWSGVLFELVDELAVSLNFSYEVVEPSDRNWGSADDSGTFNGLIGMVQRREVDFALGLFTTTPGRQDAVDFSSALLIDTFVIAMKKPDMSDSKMFLCLGPFSFEVWIAVLSAVLVIGILSWIITRWHPLHDRPISHTEPEEIYQFDVNLWQTMGALLQQGMVYIPTYHSSRVVIALWWLFVIVVVGTYNGNLIAFLTAPKVTVPINDLDELVNSGMAIGVTANTAAQDIFEDSDSGVYKDVWNIVKEDSQYNLVSGNIEGFQKMYENPNFAYLIEKLYYESMAKKLAENSADFMCDYVRSKSGFYQSIFALPFQKGSPYVRSFSRRILQILESGLLKHWRDLYYMHSNACSGLERTADQTTISLAEAQGAFYILGIGLVIALLSLVSEWIYRHKQMKRIALLEAKERAKDKRVYYVGSMSYAKTFHAMMAAMGSQVAQREISDDNAVSQEEDPNICSAVNDVDDIIVVVDNKPDEDDRLEGPSNSYRGSQSMIWRQLILDDFASNSSLHGNGSLPNEYRETRRRSSGPLKNRSNHSVSTDNCVGHCEMVQQDTPVFEATIESDAETGEHFVSATI